jgi:hypothetical protein
MRGGLFRSAESEAIIQDVLMRILYNDPLSRDGDRRNNGLMAAAVFGGIGSRDDFRLEDAVLKEDIRRFVHPFYLWCESSDEVWVSRANKIYG